MPPTRANTDAIECAYRQHGPALLLFAKAIIGEPGRAQDTVHQVFWKLLERGGLRDVSDATAYLFGSVRNAALNEMKVRKRDLEFDLNSAWFEPPSRDYAEEMALRRALGALPEDQRQITILHVWGDLTFSQVGEVLGISPNTAASRYRYALVKLREAMGVKEHSRANP